MDLTPDDAVAPGRDVWRAPTRSDVARRAGVSTAVVSYVVNNGPRPVAAATRERVLAAMSELGYRPNGLARALRLRRAQAVGLVVPDVGNIYYGALAREISDRAFLAGYAMLLGDSNNQIDRERAQIESLVGRQIDGLVVVSLEPGSKAETGDTPVVYLDQRSVPGQLSIVVDNPGGAALAVEHLLGHGRRRIAHLAGPEGAPGSSERRRGWAEALAAAGIEPSDDLLARGDYTREGGRRAGLDLLTRSGRPDAVFVASDVQALGLLVAARELGLRVPEDIAVISFDGTEESLYSAPPLTAIEQPLDRLAEAALATVLGDEHPDERRVVPVRLVVRESCGCAPTPA